MAVNEPIRNIDELPQYCAMINDPGAGTWLVAAAPGAGLRIVVVGIVGDSNGVSSFLSGVGTLILPLALSSGRPIFAYNRQGLCNCDTNEKLDVLIAAAGTSFNVLYKIVPNFGYVG